MSQVLLTIDSDGVLDVQPEILLVGLVVEARMVRVVESGQLTDSVDDNQRLFAVDPGNSLLEPVIC